MKPRPKTFLSIIDRKQPVIGKLSNLTLIGLSLLSLSSCQDSGLIAPPVQSFGGGINTDRAEQSPQLSYDGRYLAFASDRQGQRSIYLYDRVSNQLVPLPGLNLPNTWQDQPDVSADGRYIVYLSEQSGKPDIWLYDRQTLRAQNLSEKLLGEVRHPSISGNGRTVAFESNRTGQWDLIFYDRGLGVEISPPQPLDTPPIKKGESNPP
jgi:Tol biopolymer transport system component